MTRTVSVPEWSEPRRAIFPPIRGVARILLGLLGLNPPVEPAEVRAAWDPVRLQGAPTRYMVDVERYRFGATPDVRNPAFYPIPQDSVTRETYLRCLEEAIPAEIARQPALGMDGPRAFMPVLVKFVQTGEEVWAKACIAMLKAFHAEMQRQAAERKWFWQFVRPAALIPLYRQFLIQGHAMKPGADWFRTMWLTYCRNLHVWDSEPIEWGGGCHRSMAEGYAKGLAATGYPDIPEVAHWKQYSELVFDDFWKAKDVAQNDTGYMMGPLIILACGGDQWTGDGRAFTDPGTKRLWDRLLVEVSPDGSINPYGPNGGWNSTADYRLAMLERGAAKTGGGRYRFAAHKLLNYLRYQSRAPGLGGHRLDAGADWLVSLAWLFADESVQPVPPEAGSLWNQRGEVGRIPHTDKQLTERLMGNADPRQDSGRICCSWPMTGHQWPDKLVLRSGWNPGDFFALVELHPTSFPANPGGIMGLNRWGAPLTHIVTSKGASVENRALIEDLGKTATRRYHPDRLRIDEFWRSGTMPDIRSEVAYFEETPEATYVKVRVRNMDGLPVTYAREFVFVKNRFLASREAVTFEESLEVRHLWEGRPAVGEILVFTQVYYPHAPYRARASSNNPIPGAKAGYTDDLQATAHACGIQVLRDDPEATILRLELEPGRVEWVVSKPAGQPLTVAGTDRREPMFCAGVPEQGCATRRKPLRRTRAPGSDRERARVCDPPTSPRHPGIL